MGTGATRTSTYAEVTSVPPKVKFPLLSDTRGKITMTEFGDMSYRLLPGTRIGDLGNTERLYATMREVAAGTTTADAELAIVADWVREDITTMQQNAVSMRKELGLGEVQQVQRKEKHSGVWAVSGEPTKFSREWSGHTFTDMELEDLLAGKEIVFTAISKAQSQYEARGKLATQEYNGATYVGFKPDFRPKQDASGNDMPPRGWCKHTFTPDEAARLVAGEKVFIDDFESKAGKTFGATVHFGVEKGGTEKKIIPEFG